MNRKLLGICALAASAIVATSLVADESGDVNQQRHDLMESMGGAIQSMGNMLRGIEPYDAEKMRELAGRIAASGGDTMTALFPEGSMSPDGGALPAIWEDWDRFTTLAGNLVDAANAVAAAADNPPGPPSAGPPDPASGGGEPQAMDAGMAVIQLGMSCGACHDDFRKEDDS